MIQATILAPLAVAVVLVVSAAAKFRDPASVDQAFEQLRVPAALGRPWVKRVVPWAEVVLAVGLIALPSSWAAVAAAGTTVLFCSYTWLIVRAWRAPVDADCHCFGSLATGRVTGWTVLRNALLVALSLAAIADAVGAAPVLLRLADVGVLAWVCGAALVGLLVFTIVHEPADAVGPGASEFDDEEYVRLPIPYSRVTTAAGDQVTLRQLARQGAQLLVHVSATCGACRSVIEALPGWQASMPEVRVRPVVWEGGAQPSSFGPLAEHVLVDTDNAMSVLEMHGTPSAVLLGADGLVAGGPVAGSGAIAELVEGMIEQLEEARGPVATASGE